MQLAVIIPTLNEADTLARTIELARRRARIVPDITVVDCGSRDATVSIATHAGCRVLVKNDGATGKSGALNLGARDCRAEVILFLDADSEPPPEYDRLVEVALQDPRSVGGAFHFKLDRPAGPSAKLRLVEIINHIRYFIWPEYYGDQGIFVRRAAFQKVGGFPDRAILEAAHLCRRLRQLGRLTLVRACMITSPRRFLDGGVLRVLLSDSWIWLRDRLGLSTEHFAAGYWHYNASRGRKT
ncbi:MAG: glycosyltransferase [Spirochaetales bacterium]|nr:glycosyltransferase [Leptospiraceae bacterium]MCP5482021.1 glycosyltransferase [Spirochaetales bacterium]MCP5486502.1 glycosyltransferase [Spirochaetales bacterium]